MERFDVVDENGIPTGETVERSTAHALGLRHRTAHIWIVRRYEGVLQVLLQKRAQNKDSYPGCWDTSSAGHIQAGDEPLASALRELQEELGIHARTEDLHYADFFRIDYATVFYGRPFRDHEVAFTYVYTEPVDPQTLTLQKEEVEATAWFAAEDVLQAMAAGNENFCVPVKGLQIAMQWCREQGI